MPNDQGKPRSLKDLKSRLAQGGANQPPQGQPQGASAGFGQGPGGNPFAGGAPQSSPFGGPAGFPGQQPVEPAFGSPGAPPPEAYDDTPFTPTETGSRNKTLVLVAAGIAILIGLAVGFGIGSTSYDRKLHNLMIRDAKAIDKSVEKASKRIDEVDKVLGALFVAARGGGNGGPEVDFKTLETLKSIENPFRAQEFARKRYQTFQPSTVDALFRYYDATNHLWGSIQSLNAMVISKEQRDALQTAAKAAGSLAETQTGCVPTLVDEGKGVRCNLVFVRVGDGSVPSSVMVSSSQKGGGSMKKVLGARDTLGSDPSSYVILTDTAQSVRVLGQQASLFAEYQRDIFMAKKRVEELKEIGAQLRVELKTLASKPELVAL